MLSNMSTTDRIIRFILAVVIAVLGFVYHSWWGLVAIIPLFTAMLNWCPLYAALGISTKPKKLNNR